MGVINNKLNQPQQKMTDTKKKPAFAGRTIQGSKETRAASDPIVQRDSFIQFYPQFFENFDKLDDDTKQDFQARGNAVLDDRNVGDSICGGDADQAREELEELATSDLKNVMNFLIDEQVIEFDD